MIIAIGSSRTSKIWKNTEISFDELAKKCSNCIKAPVTREEVNRLSPADRGNYKDKGGFVGGELKDGKRRSGSVVSRSLITLDLDHAKTGALDAVHKALNEYTYILYSTFSHTTEHPRYRIVLPTNQLMTEEQYEPIARKVASWIDIDTIDPSCFRPTQLMYWPVTPRDGVCHSETHKGRSLGVDEILESYEDWKDCLEWPCAETEHKEIHAVAKLGDPTLKTGAVGEFCRAYTISEAIDKYLKDVYEPGPTDDRWHLIGSDSVAGALVYQDDHYLYSHHKNDPAFEKCCNAFDLVRIHKFGGLDKKETYTDVTKRPSFKKMCELVASDEKVKDAELKVDFQVEVQEDDPLWKPKLISRLEMSKEGAIKTSIRNLNLIINNDRNLRGIMYDEFSDLIVVTAPLPWLRPSYWSWRESDLANLQVYIAKTYVGMSPSITAVYNVLIAAVTRERIISPVKDYIEALPKWDGVKRAERIFIDYLGAEDTEYTKNVTRKFLLAAIRRVYKPGCKFDYMPVLVGPQGIGKSTIFKLLAGKWFSDSLQITDMKDKTGAEKLIGNWIVEIGELSGMRRTETETVKSFISCAEDKYRAAYDRTVSQRPRRSVLVGTTNDEDGFLRDATGNRRFWVIPVRGGIKPEDWHINIGQIWAEALSWGLEEPLYLTGSIAKQAEEYQRAGLEHDPREGIIDEFLRMKLPANWNELGIFERRNYINDPEERERNPGAIERKYVSIMEVWCEALGKDKADLTYGESVSLSRALQKLGWIKAIGKYGEGIRMVQIIYGRQRIFEPVPTLSRSLSRQGGRIKVLQINQ